MMTALTEAALQDRPAVSANVVPPQAHETHSSFLASTSWTGDRNVVLAAEATFFIGFRAVVERRCGCWMVRPSTVLSFRIARPY